MKTNEIIIKISKTKIISLIVGSLLFVILGFWIAFYGPTVGINILDIFRKPIGFLSIIFFGILGVLYTIKLFKNKYGIKINDEGIYDSSSFMNSGLMKWDYIERIEKSKLVNQKFIRIIVSNPNDVIERQRNVLTRKIVVSNFKKYGSPIQISTNGLKIGFDELYDLLTNELNKRKQYQKDI